MASWRTEPLPSDWRRIRAGVLARDGHRCTWFPGSDPSGSDYLTAYQHPYRCSSRATDVDHVGDPGDHDHTNLRSLCSRHHASKTASDAVSKRQSDRRRRTGFEPPRHPGLKPE